MGELHPEVERKNIKGKNKASKKWWAENVIVPLAKFQVFLRYRLNPFHWYRMIFWPEERIKERAIKTIGNNYLSFVSRGYPVLARETEDEMSQVLAQYGSPEDVKLWDKFVEAAEQIRKIQTYN